MLDKVGGVCYPLPLFSIYLDGGLRVG